MSLEYLDVEVPGAAVEACIGSESSLPLKTLAAGTRLTFFVIGAVDCSDPCGSDDGLGCLELGKTCCHISAAWEQCGTKTAGGSCCGGSKDS